jgi:hypothetical protein
MAVDALGNTFITGKSFDGTYEGYLTVKYDHNDISSGGLPQWRATLSGSASAPQQPFAIAVDATGNVFVAGDSTVKYNANGIEQWQRTESFRSYALALGPAGTVVVGGTGGLIIKYGANGNEIWRHAINGALDGNDVVYTLAVDVDGAIYATGRKLSDPSGDYDYLTVKLDADGNERWRVTTPTAGGGAMGTPALVLDATRNLILAGNAVTGGLPAAIMVTKFSQAPPAPGSATASPGNGMASVSFTPPTVTESPIGSYTVTCRLVSGLGALVATGISSPIIVTGLSNDLAYACSVTATSAFGTSQPSADANVTPSATAPLALFAVKSTKKHGLVDYSLNVELSPIPVNAVTVEPRALGTGHTLVFQFNNIISTIDTTSASTGSVAALASGSDVIVKITGVPDNQRVQVSFAGVTCTNGSTIASTGATVGFLVGDVNSTGAVTAADISAVKAHVGQSTSLSNFKFDLNASGIIDASDLSAVKARAGLLLP